MPAWILTLIENIGPLSTTVEGVVKIGEAIVAELKSTDGTAVMAEKILADFSAAATEIDKALVANT